MTTEENDCMREARLLAYRVFQNIFGNAPTEQALAIIADGSTAEALASFEAFAPDADYAEALEAALRPLDDCAKDPAAFVKEAASSYTKLFIGPGSLAASPWSSHYLADPTLLFQEHTLQIRGLYRAQGFLPEAYPHVADDHIALELDFLAHLAERSLSESDGASLTASQAFLQNHLLAWAPRYIDNLAGAAEGTLWQPFGQLLVRFLRADSAYLDSLSLSAPAA